MIALHFYLQFAAPLLTLANLMLCGMLLLSLSCCLMTNLKSLVGGGGGGGGGRLYLGFSRGWAEGRGAWSHSTELPVLFCSVHLSAVSTKSNSFFFSTSPA